MYNHTAADGKDARTFEQSVTQDTVSRALCENLQTVDMRYPKVTLEGLLRLFNCGTSPRNPQ